MFFRKAFKLNLALLPLCYLLSAWTINYLLGFISFEHARQSILARDAGAAVVLPLLTAILWWGRAFSTSFSIQALSYVASHRRSRNTSKLATIFENIISLSLKKIRPIILFSACLIALNYLYWEGLFTLKDNQIEETDYRYILLLQALPFWFCIFNFIAELIIVFRLSKIYTTKYLRVRLFELEELSPLCNVAIVNFLVSFLAVSAYSLSGLFVDIPDTDKYVMLIMCIMLAFFLLSPIFLIRRVIKERKEVMLERINGSLNEQVLLNSDGNSYRRLVDDDIRLQFISDLLIVRKEVSHAPLWPMSVPFAVKMMLILMLPVLSWMGAGFVSQFLKVWQL